MQVDEQKFMEIAEKVMHDERPLVVTISIKECWLLISWLQLVTRHPEISDYMLTMIEKCGRDFQTVIEAAHPEAAPLIEMGWHSEYDVRK